MAVDAEAALLLEAELNRERQRHRHLLPQMAAGLPFRGSGDDAHRLLVEERIDAPGHLHIPHRSGRIDDKIHHHTALDEEAVRVISASPKWRPGRHRGKKVKVALTVPVDFRLEKNSKGGFGINGKRIK